MTKLAIFDLDGTLLNTITDLAVSVNQALEQYGFPTHDEATYKHFVGNGIQILFKRALPSDARTPENIQRIQDAFMPYYTAHKSDLTAPYAGLVHMLEDLQVSGMRLGVASNKYHAGTLAMVEQHFPTIHFDLVLGQRDSIPVKPHPQVLHDIMQHTGTAPADTVFIGDSDVDMQTARNAHITAIGVTWGFRTPDELIVNGANHLVNTPQELKALLLR